MLDLSKLEIKRIDNTNVYQEFSVYFKNHDFYNHEYKFTMKVYFEIGGDTVYVDVESLRYFDTLQKLIHHTLNLLDEKVNSYRIRYKYSRSRYISFDKDNTIMKIYHGQMVLADVYLQEDYVDLYDCESKKGGAFCFLDQNKLHLMRADDLNLANKLLEENESEILTAINYFKFLTKR